MVNQGVFSGPCSFDQFEAANATFLDKSLVAIEAFLPKFFVTVRVTTFTAPQTLWEELYALNDSVKFLSYQISVSANAKAYI